MGLLKVVSYFVFVLIVFNLEIQPMHANSPMTTAASTTTSTTASPVSQHQWNKIIFTIVASLSIFGSVAIIATYFLWQDLQTTARRILVYISIGDFFTVYPNLVIYWTGQYQDNNFSCRFQSFVTSVAVMWSFFWTSSLAIYLYTALVKKLYDRAERLVLVFHVVNWGIPIILLSLAWYRGYLGYSHDKSTVGWCWIVFEKAEHQDDIVWMFISGKLWEIISYFINAVFYYLVTRNIKKEVSARYHLMSTQSVQIAEQGGKKLALVPIIFVVLRIWGTIRFFLLLSSANPPEIIVEILVTLQVIGDNSQGIANFILFCLLTERFKRNTCRICCGCCRRSSEHSPLFSKSYEKRGGTFSDPAI